MTKKIVIALALLAFVASGIGFIVSADTNKQASQLTVLLPESDGVVVFNSEKFLSQALPQILSANQPILSKVNSKIDELKGKTGLDLRQFTEVAVGIKSSKNAQNKIELEPVILARGTMSSKALVAVAKLASKGKYKTETVGSREIYIFSAKEVVEKNKSKDKSGNSVSNKGIDMIFKQFSKEVALTAFDTNTIAIGSVSRVKETIGNSPRISNEVLSLLGRKENTVVNMGMVLPSGLSQYVGLDNDEMGTNLDAIREIQGSMDVVNNSTSVSIMAKTLQTNEAESLEEMLMGLQMVGKGLLGGMKGNDKQVYARMVENMKISREMNQVMLDLNVPQSDLDVIIGKK